jgi:nitrogen fixation protein NifM
MVNGYTELKLAWGLFEKAPEALDEAQRERVREVAGRQAQIERDVLSTREAANVVVTDKAMAAALADIRGRYASAEEFSADLERNGLDESSLQSALRRELRVESVLERIASKAPKVTAVDAELYYRTHPDAFDRPESRRLRHILVTFNSPAEREAAVALLEGIRADAPPPAAFGELALAHSHCPTAMQSGELGVVRRGQLFPELEPIAFALAEGELSAPIESPMGMHLIRCDEILPDGMVPFEDIAERIIERLTLRRRAQAQKDWLSRISVPA